jgi:hypothetical protein
MPSYKKWQMPKIEKRCTAQGPKFTVKEYFSRRQTQTFCPADLAG